MNDDQLAREVLGDLQTKKSIFWEKEREKNALALFHRAASSVPAYKDFLKKNRVNPAKIKTFADFQSVPSVSKANYLRVYPLKDIVWGGTLKKPMVFTATSGSTGKPFYFPRGRQLDWESSVLHEFFLQNGVRPTKGGGAVTKNPSTLVIVGFGMGAWIGGLITYKAFEIANERGASVAIITPGTNKGEIFHALRELAPQFQQTILTGYPPFVKDIIDEAPEQGINLKKINIRILFAAESFSEKFREYIAEKAGIKNVYLDTLNVYGTADIGTMAYETPAAILIRRLALKNKKLFTALFSEIERTPTLAQYNPHFITFEAPDGNILLTGNNTVPLVRYAIGDHGGLVSFADAIKKVEAAGINWKREIDRAGIKNHITELPLVYVYERADMSTKLYGAIIYPEHIKAALFSSYLKTRLTGKFVMKTTTDSRHNERMEINVELRARQSASVFLMKKIQRAAVDSLLKKNAEYHYLYGLMPLRVTPKIVFRTHGDLKYFRGGGKQKWVEKIKPNN